MEKNIVCESFGKEDYSFSVCCQGWDKKSKIVVYSFGVGEDLSFSEQLVQKWEQCEIFAFDPTPKAIKFVEQFDKSVFSRFEFYPMGLSDKNITTDFYLPQNPDYVSGSELNSPIVDSNNIVKVQMHTMKYIMDMLGHKHVDLVKMNIEGSEFAAIIQMLEEVEGIEQICVEFHHRFYSDGEIRLKNTLDSLQSHGYVLVNTSKSKKKMTFLKEV